MTFLFFTLWHKLLKYIYFNGKQTKGQHFVNVSNSRLISQFGQVLFVFVEGKNANIWVLILASLKWTKYRIADFRIT